MKKLVTNAEVFGPYKTVKTLSDRYQCDDVHLPFTVVGQGEISDVVDGDFPEPEPVAESAAALPTKEQLMAELAALTAKIQALE